MSLASLRLRSVKRLASGSDALQTLDSTRNDDDVKTAPSAWIVGRVRGHPFTTMLFVLSCMAIVLSAIIASPRNSAIVLRMLAGLPVYYFWRKLLTHETRK